LERLVVVATFGAARHFNTPLLTCFLGLLPLQLGMEVASVIILVIGVDRLAHVALPIWLQDFFILIKKAL
jgi:hypothetical protein